MTFSNAELLGKVLPSTLEGFVTLLLWHSVFFTASTPIMRFFTKKWLYVLSAPFVVGRDDAIKETYPESEIVDRAWIPHAIFGLLWLCVGSAQFLITPKMKGKVHKLFGYFAIVVFIGHLGAASYTLYIDALKHTFLNKMFLVNDLTEGVFYMTMGMVAVIQRKKGWLQKHKDQMFFAFVTSIEGAGTIRTIGFIHYLMEKAGVRPNSFIWQLTGAGLSQCQNKHRIVATDCEWEYTFRLTAIRFLTNLYVHQYATFTPSAVKVANQRWKNWVTMVSILGVAADQDFPPHYAFVAVFLSSAFNNGYHARIGELVFDRVLIPLARKVVERSGQIIVEVPNAEKIAQAAVDKALEEFESFNRSRSSRLNPAPEGKEISGGPTTTDQSEDSSCEDLTPSPQDLQEFGFLRTPAHRGNRYPGRRNSIKITTTIEGDFQLGCLGRNTSTCSEPSRDIPKLGSLGRNTSTCSEPPCNTSRWSSRQRARRDSRCSTLWARSKAPEYTTDLFDGIRTPTLGVSPLDLGLPMAEHRRELLKLRNKITKVLLRAA